MNPTSTPTDEAEPPSAPTSDAQGAERRRHGRLRTDLAGEIVTALGPVVDLSRGGMRIATVGKPPVHEGLKCSLEVRCAEVQATLPVEVMRVRPSRKRRWDVGLRFRELDPAQARALSALARMAVNTADPTRPSK
ncbi:MAG: PilZ domain-containing protein [Planctomycetota bacterium]